MAKSLFQQLNTTILEKEDSYSAFVQVLIQEMGKIMLPFSMKRTVESKFSKLTQIFLSTPTVESKLTSLEEGLGTRGWPVNLQPQVSGLRHEPKSCLLWKVFEYGVLTHSL